MNLSTLGKIRCRFLHHTTGKPVSGVVASLSISLGESVSSHNLSVGTLCTDATGYLSFDLKPLIDAGIAEASHILISAPKFGLKNLDLLSLPDVKSESDEGGAAEASSLSNSSMKAHFKPGAEGRRDNLCIVFPIYVKSPKEDVRAIDQDNCEQIRLPAIQSPDVCDHKVSPFSFVTPINLTLGNDCCETLIPSFLPIQEYHFYKVIVRRENQTYNTNKERLTDRRATGPLGSLRLAHEVKVWEDLESRNPTIRFGEVLQYKQSWFSLGHSLGEIKYSLALAPGESTQIAVIEWSRDDIASRTDKVRGTEFLDHDSRRDRAIDESVDAALRETQEGSSFMAGTSGAATIPLQYVQLSFNHAIGGSVSYSSGHRKLESESLQDLHDRVRQTSSSIRSLSSTVIVQGFQSEKNVLQTRRVANHNHCHALTIQYYEVLRQYRMCTEFKGRRKAVLIPFSPFPFTWQTALRFRSILEQIILEPSLKGCFDALVRINLANSGTTQKVVFVVGTQGEGVRTGILIQSGNRIIIDATGRITYARGGALGVGALSAGPEGNKAKASSTFLAPGLDEYSLIYKIGENGPWRQAGSHIETSADRDGEIIFGMNDTTGNFADNYGFGNDYWSVTIAYPASVYEIEGPVTPPPPKKTQGQQPPKPKMVIKTKTVEVLGTEGEGYGSGILVKKDDEITMHASGEITFARTAAWSKGPNGDKGVKGDSRFLAPGFDQWSLIFKIGNDGNWRQGGLVVNTTADRDGEIIFGVNDTKGDFADNYGWEHDSWSVKVDYPSHEEESPPTPTNPEEGDAQSDDLHKSEKEVLFSRIEDQICASKLLVHLQGNQGYYNRAVWMLMDAVERRLYLETALTDHIDILDSMDDNPIAISGNYVAFPFRGEIQQWNDEREDDPKAPIEDIVTFPTRGMFAEAQKGHCNSCEMRDITRMWDWTLMTTEEPPQISGIVPGPSGQAPNLSPAQLPSNVIQITQPQAAPDPVGLAAALGVIGKPDIFRDMSGLKEVGDLLDTLAKGATTSLSGAQQLAAQAREKLAEYQNQAASTDGNKSGQKASSGQTPTEQLDNLQVAKEVAKYAEQIGLTKDQKSEAVQEALDGHKSEGDGKYGAILKEILGATTTKTSIVNNNPKPCINEDVTFTVQNISSSVTTISWSGGGTPLTGTGLSFTTRFPKAGTKVVTVTWSTNDGGTATFTATVEIKDQSGPQWAAQFPYSASTSDLTSGFQTNVDDFISALTTAGATVKDIVTFRPAKRAYLMYYAWQLGHGNILPKDVPPFDPASVPAADPYKGDVDICWLHRDSSGAPDEPKSVKAANDMIPAYSIVYKPAYPTNHSEKIAIDMTISWTGDLKVKDKSGTIVTITSTPRDGSNTDLHAVGASYNVLKLVGDRPHWSENGH